VTSELHALAALTPFPKEREPVWTGQEAGLSPEPIWTLWKKKNLFEVGPLGTKFTTN
jgi:hypothetical protein